LPVYVCSSDTPKDGLEPQQSIVPRQQALQFNVPNGRSMELRL
jgi:hypothetical protein